jgi:hypothetical protein
VDRISLARLLRRQSGVVTRHQLLDLGALSHDVRRLLRRRELVAVHSGVYVDHTGPLSRRQREWAAVLALEPAALHRQSALDAAGMTRDRRSDSGSGPVHVMVDARRTVGELPGIRIERVRDAASWVAKAGQPPRATVEFAVLKAAADCGRTAAVAVLADVCRQGLTTPERLLTTLQRMVRLPGRSELLRLLTDVASGVHSVLEHRYLTDVERAHGLPRGSRQVRVDTTSGALFRDVRYSAQCTLVELDGRFGHTDTDDRWHDLDRDLAAAVAGDITVRLGWGQVLEPCRVAAALASILRARGWDGRPTACGPGCPVDRVALVSPGDSDPTRSARPA